MAKENALKKGKIKSIEQTLSNSSENLVSTKNMIKF